MPHTNPTAQYHTLMEDILDNGIHCANRTGIDTHSVFGRVMRFNISEGKVPLIHSKKVFTKGIFHELVWMLSGDTNIRYLKQHGVNIWDSWVKPGTEEYRDMTHNEVFDALVSFKVSDRSNQNEISLIDDVDDPEGLHKDYFEINRTDVRLKIRYSTDESLRNVYREVFGKEPLALVAGELPKIYQHQWRRWADTRVIPEAQLAEYELVGFKAIGHYQDYEGDEQAMCVVRREIDQIQNLVDKLRNNPDDRRIILSAWNVAEIEEMALPPCHTLLHLKPYKLGLSERMVIAEERNIPLEEVATHRLSGLLYQRSADVPIGVPFNIVQYSLLIQMLAHVTNMETGEFVWVGGDCHIYENQIETCNRQLSRPTEGPYTPRIILDPRVKDIFDFTVEDIAVVDYNPQPVLKFPAAAV